MSARTWTVACWYSINHLARLRLIGRLLPQWLAKKRDGAYPPMVADVQAGWCGEVEQLNRKIVLLARATGLAAPVNGRIVAMVEDMRASAHRSPAQLRAALAAGSLPGALGSEEPPQHEADEWQHENQDDP